MKTPDNVKYYPVKEEKVNIISHGIGLVLSIIALGALIYKSTEFTQLSHIFSFLIFGASLVLLYAASTFYHAAKTDKKRHRLNVLDHASIYVLIAGTYTPYTLITLPDDVGRIILITIWSVALVGVILKLFYAGRYQVFSTIMYVLMGCIIILAIQPLVNNFSFGGLLWLLLGGVSYVFGAVIFSFNKIKFNHAIFHFFVLGGSICHFISIQFYV